LASCDPSNKVINLWDAGAGELKRTLDTKDVQAWSAAFSPDSAALAVGGQKRDGSGEVTVWDVEKGTSRHALAHAKFVTAVAFSPDGKMVAACDGGERVQIWDPEKGERIASLQGDERCPRAVAFMSSRVVAVGGRDGKVRLWDARTGTLKEILEGHSDEVYSVVRSPDGKTLASASQDETARLWPINGQDTGSK
jgi:WD40 repeat protein